MFALSIPRAFVLIAVASSLVACRDKPYDPDGPGDFIGVFSVDATQDSNTCGAGAFGSVVDWTFDMRLSREIGIAYWNNGSEYIQGTMSADKHSFSFETNVVENMRTESSPAWLPPCSVARQDQSSGKLADDDASFTGKLSYSFAATNGSDCSDLVASGSAGFTILPCAMTYSLDAKRTSTTP